MLSAIRRRLVLPIGFLFVVLPLSLHVLRFHGPLSVPVVIPPADQQELQQLAGSPTQSTAVTPLNTFNASFRFNGSRPHRHVIGRMRMDGGRLGNEMFVYAAVLGIAHRNQMLPVYRGRVLRVTFDLGAEESCPGETGDQSTAIVEYSAFMYDRRFETLSTTGTLTDVTAVGFFQSWKYFRDVRQLVRTEFQFKTELRQLAQSYLRYVTNKHRSALGEGTKPLYVGVHIRRTDMLADYNVAKGYTVADRAYLDRARQHLHTQFPNHTLLYIVCSDDMPWAKDNFPLVAAGTFTPGPGIPTPSPYFPTPPPAAVVAFAEGHSTEQDLAVLAACNHTIMTVGTYGWWAGYLSGGTTVYYSNFPAAGSSLAGWFSKEDFFPPDWVGL